MIDQSHQESLNYITAALQEYVETLKPAAQIAVGAFANEHIKAITSALNEVQTLRNRVDELEGKLQPSYEMKRKPQPTACALPDSANEAE